MSEVYVHLGNAFTGHRPSHTIRVRSATEARRISSECRRDGWPCRFQVGNEITTLAGVLRAFGKAPSRARAKRRRR